MILIDQLRQVCQQKGKWLERPGELNLVGIRNTRDPRSNKFNDFVVAVWIDESTIKQRFLICEATTDPGVYYRNNPINVEGTAVLPEDFYPGLWKLGLHKGKYPALVQSSPIKVWRDNDKDANIDHKVISKPGMFGINLHRANEFVTSTEVDKWSAGCQVIADPKNFTQIMYLAKRHAVLYGDSFDYLLITDRDIKNVE
jgi:hypothetical protein